MKRMITLLLTAALVLSLCACGGNFRQIDLQEAMAIPEDGVIAEKVVAQIKEENAIGVFTGTSGAFAYEWTIFGSDIAEVREINLHTDIEETAAGEVAITLSQQEAFGFSGLLSVYLNEAWAAQTATAYRGGEAVASVSLTGSKTTILNLTTDGTLGTVVVRGDAAAEDAVMDVVKEEQEKAEKPSDTKTEHKTDSYLTPVTDSAGQVYSGEKDQYQTEIIEGKPKPVEPENQQKGETITVTFSIECATILNNLDMLDPDKLELVPSNGVILAKTTVTCNEGESVFDVLQRICKENGIHMEAEWTPIYNSAYVEGIHNLYEFDCGSLSGWMYRVNGWYPNYGCSRYVLKAGDVVEWRYTCDLGHDVGGHYAVGGLG